MNQKLLVSICLCCTSMLAASENIDYTDGVFFVNEDWYGHQNSTINFLNPNASSGEEWHYRVFQKENPGKELGCTNQYGAIHDGRFFLIAKQAKDPGAKITGGRITVADAITMKMLFQSELIDPSGNQCDGRGFAGLDSHKGYISTSHGVWVFDLDKYSVTKMVEGTENPYGYSSGGNTNSAGALYHGQCGSMLITEGKLFVAHQEYGLLVVNTETDIVEHTISMDIVEKDAGIGSIVLSKDGNIWASIAKSKDGLGATLPYLVKINPSSLQYEIIEIPETIFAPANSWYAWTPDAFCSSNQRNLLYWNGGANSWFSTDKIFRYDIDNNKFSEIIDLSQETAQSVKWKLYGCSMRVHPDTDELYMSLFHEFGTPVYITRTYDCNGIKLREYPMIENYWFPSIPVFPDSKKQSGIEANTLSGIKPTVNISNRRLTVLNGCGKELHIYNLQGRRCFSVKIDSDDFSTELLIPSGFYIDNFSHKLIIN